MTTTEMFLVQDLQTVLLGEFQVQQHHFWMLAGVASSVGAAAKNKIQSLGAILNMDQFVGEVAARERSNRQFRVVWTVFDQEDFGILFSIHFHSSPRGFEEKGWNFLCAPAVRRR